jgi:hypothetical protein
MLLNVSKQLTFIYGCEIQYADIRAGGDEIALVAGTCSENDETQPQVANLHLTLVGKATCSDVQTINDPDDWCERSRYREHRQTNDDHIEKLPYR